MVAYKLTYLEGRGAAEVSRQILAYAGVPFEDKRVSREQWQTLKATSNSPFGKLPLLEVDGKVLAQSLAIARYLAREYGLSGANAWEEAQVNSLADQFKDFMNEIHPYLIVKFGMAPGDVDAVFNDVFLPSFRKNYTFLANFLKTSGSGFLVGKGLTYVDLIVAQITDDLLVQDPKLFAEFPELKAHSHKIQSIPAIKAWIEKRPVTPF